MVNVEFKKSIECSDATFNSICILKSKCWDYSIEEHLKWMIEHYNSDDIHLLLWKEKVLIGYLCINNICINTEKGGAYVGIGNVCTDPEYRGLYYGHLIMDYAKCYIIYILKKNAILLCKKKMYSFYKRIGWLPFTGSAYIGFEKFDNYIFSLFPIKIQKIIIDRNF